MRVSGSSDGIIARVDQKAALERLALVDLVVSDVGVELSMYVARRADNGDAETFVIQTGEEGRHRVQLRNMSDPLSIERCARDVQRHLSALMGRGLPRCPVRGHEHALNPQMRDGQLVWRCPDNGWSCGLGDYEENSWPQIGVSLAPILVHRLARRGLDNQWAILSVPETPRGRVAKISVQQLNDSLVTALANAAAPLPVEVAEYDGPPGPIRVGTGSISRKLS